MENNIGVLERRGPSLRDLPNECTDRIFSSLAGLNRQISNGLTGRVLHDDAADAFALGVLSRDLLASFRRTVLADVVVNVASPREFTSPNITLQPALKTASLAHVRALIRLAGESLRSFELQAYPSRKSPLDSGLVIDVSFERPSDVASPLRPGPILADLQANAKNLKSLSLTHPQLIMDDDEIDSLARLWSSRAQTLTALRYPRMSAKIATRLADVSVSMHALKELRLPDFQGSYEQLVAILSHVHERLLTLEIGGIAVPGPVSGIDFNQAARPCKNLIELRVARTPPSMAGLGLALVANARGLCKLTLHMIEGQLGVDDCLAMRLIYQATASCPFLSEIHMIDCNVVGESETLFQTVGKRLRSFTGTFLWENVEELDFFSAACPNVERLSLRCGDEHQQNDSGRCGVSIALQRFGHNLKSLVVCNANVDETSFLDAMVHATGLEELVLIGHPKLSPEGVCTILRATGANLRSLTIIWGTMRVAQYSDGSEDTRLLQTIIRNCPRLEILCLPRLWTDATLTYSQWENVKTVLSQIESQLPNLSILDSQIGSHCLPRIGWHV